MCLFGSPLHRISSSPATMSLSLPSSRIHVVVAADGFARNASEVDTAYIPNVLRDLPLPGWADARHPCRRLMPTIRAHSDRRRWQAAERAARAWLNPPTWWCACRRSCRATLTASCPRDEECAKELKKRTLTNLYNQRPAWLANIHQELDAAVAAAYGWPADLTDERSSSACSRSTRPEPASARPTPPPSPPPWPELFPTRPPFPRPPPADFRLRRCRGHRVPRSHGPPERNVNPKRLTHR